MGDQVVDDALIQVFLQGRGNGHGGSSIAWAIRHIGGTRAVASRCGRTRCAKATPAGWVQQCPILSPEPDGSRPDALLRAQLFKKRSATRISYDARAATGWNPMRVARSLSIVSACLVTMSVLAGHLN